MSNYLIDQMVWSHSRINSFLSCPYQFYLKYICGIDSKRMFFSDYGSFIHELLALYYSGKISRDEAVLMYITQFRSKVAGIPPSTSVFTSFYQQGLQCVKNLTPIEGSVEWIEAKTEFRVDDLDFVGILDCVYRDQNGSLIIRDHKSRDLKPRSRRIKPTFHDQTLDEYLRQLYIYSIPVKTAFCRFPDFLEFNCYRSGTLIKEPFQQQAFDNTMLWVQNSVEKIRAEQEWRPNVEYWTCNYLCGLKHECEYAQTYSMK